MVWFAESWLKVGLFEYVVLVFYCCFGDRRDISDSFLSLRNNDMGGWIQFAKLCMRLKFVKRNWSVTMMLANQELVFLLIEG